MNLLLLGATGKTGREALDIALGRGHHVTAFVRSPHKVDRAHPKLDVRKGDAFDVPALASALEGRDAVLSTLGQSPRETLRPSTFMTESAAATVAAMKTAGVRRLCILSAAVLFPGSGLAYRFFSWLLEHHARDLVAMETVVTASDAEWTIARPPRLVRSPDARYVAQHDALPADSSTASFRGVATFMVDAAERAEHVRAVVGLVRPR